MTTPAALIDALRSRHIGLSVAESCTGGMLSAAITDVEGCSDVFMQGVVVYANAAKCQCLGLPPALIEQYGAVSRETAQGLAEAAARQGVTLCERSCLGLATTGIAGPQSSEQKPIGMVFIAGALADRNGAITDFDLQELQFEGERDVIRRAAVSAVLSLAYAML